MKKILITGTAGFIGYHLSLLLLKQDCEVVGLDCINDYYDVNLKYDRLASKGIAKDNIEYAKKIASDTLPNYSFIQLKLEDKDAIMELFEKEKFDIVINLAAQAGVRYSLSNPQAYVDSNISGFLSILEACRFNPVEKLIYASSSSVYGLNTDMPFTTSSNVDHPVSLYAASKKGNELMAHTYSHLFAVPTIGLRFFTVYGPWGRPDMALFLFAKAILEGKPIDVFNMGKMERDFTYVDDIVGGISCMVKEPIRLNPEWDSNNPDPGSSSAPYRLYNIGNNNPVKLMDFIKAIEKATGKVAEKKMLPLQQGDVEQTWANVDALVKDYNYMPETSIEEGIDKFMSWYRSYYKC